MKIKQCLDCTESFHNAKAKTHQSLLMCGKKNLPCSQVRKCPLFEDEDFDVLLKEWENTYD